MMDYVTPPTPVELSSLFVEEPNRCDLDDIVGKVDDDRELLEVHPVDHDSKHDFNILPRLVQRGGDMSYTINSVSNAIKSYYKEPLIRASLTDTHFKAIKTCVSSFKHGARIGRSWGAGSQYWR